jgi:glycosyltransferase 2 family protein
VTETVGLSPREATGVATTGVDEVAAPAPKPKASGPRRYLMMAARVLFTAVLIGFLAYTTIDQWSEVRATIRALAWPSIILSGVMVLAGLFAQTLAYRAALHDVGHKVTVRTTSQIYLIGLLGKYVPGSIWAFVLQMELGRRAKLQRPRVIVASLVVVGLSTVAALLLGLFGLPVLGDVDPMITVGIAVMVPCALVCSHPKVLTFLINVFLKLVKRPPLTEPFSWSAIGMIVLYSAAGWGFFGVHLWLLANATAEPGIGGVFRCVGAISLAITAGIVAFLAPSGIGVRETVIVAALTPYVGSEGAAIGIAFASRLIFTVSELVAATIAALTGLGEVRAARAALKARMSAAGGAAGVEVIPPAEAAEVALSDGDDVSAPAGTGEAAAGPDDGSR